MAFGPGKYDDLCSYVLEQAEASAAIVIVSNGNKGHGFAQQMKVVDADHAIAILTAQAQVLREVADSMQADARRLRQQKRGN
jgi:hypothetical protein